MRVFAQHSAVLLLVLFICRPLGSTEPNGDPIGGASASASAVVVNPLALSRTADLHFGAIASGVFGGEVILQPNGDRFASGDVALVASGQAAPAAFSIIGHPEALFSVFLPLGMVITNQDGSGSMLISSFTSDLDAITQLDESGTAEFNVGAVLELGPNQSEGTYSGTFEVLVAYE